MLPTNIENLVEVIYKEAKAEARSELEYSHVFWEQVELSNKKALESLMLMFYPNEQGEMGLMLLPSDPNLDSFVDVSFSDAIERAQGEDPETVELLAKILEGAALKCRETLKTAQ